MTAPPAPRPRRTRVLVVDDSAFARKVLREVVTTAPDLEVVGTARDGLDAVEKVMELAPDVIALDLVMPNLDGVGVLDAIRQLSQPPNVVVVTTADEQSPLGVAALAAGAFDVVHKPTAIASDKLYGLASELVEKLRAAAIAPRGVSGRRDRTPLPVVLERPSNPSVDVVVIGASTGGPQAIERVLTALPPTLPVPLAIVLHMPVGYTAAYVDRIDRDVRLDVFEARDGLELVPGRVVVARAGMHLKLEKNARGAPIARLDVGPVSTAHRPSVDVLFESAARAFGSRVLGVVLTGMGSDGVLGARALHDAGARVIVEAAASCVVYGMPRAVVEAGLADAEIALGEMPRGIVTRITDGAAP